MRVVRIRGAKRRGRWQRSPSETPGERACGAKTGGGMGIRHFGASEAGSNGEESPPRRQASEPSAREDWWWHMDSSLWSRRCWLQWQRIPSETPGERAFGSRRLAVAWGFVTLEPARLAPMAKNPLRDARRASLRLAKTGGGMGIRHFGASEAGSNGKESPPRRQASEPSAREDRRWHGDSSLWSQRGRLQWQRSPSETPGERAIGSRRLAVAWGFVTLEPARLAPMAKNPLRDARRASLRLAKTGGEEGIRTPGTGLSPYNGLANRRLQPLGHLTADFQVYGSQTLARGHFLRRTRSPLNRGLRRHHGAFRAASAMARTPSLIQAKPAGAPSRQRLAGFPETSH